MIAFRCQTETNHGLVPFFCVNSSASNPLNCSKTDPEWKHAGVLIHLAPCRLHGTATCGQVSKCMVRTVTTTPFFVVHMAMDDLKPQNPTCTSFDQLPSICFMVQLQLTALNPLLTESCLVLLALSIHNHPFLGGYGMALTSYAQRISFFPRKLEVVPPPDRVLKLEQRGQKHRAVVSR